MIDTDSGPRSEVCRPPRRVPDLNPYLYLRLDPPHSSERYQEAIKAANFGRGRLHCGRYRIG